MEIFEVIGEVRQAERREQYRLNAFNSYLLGSMLNPHVTELYATFEDFALAIGLSHEAEPQMADVTKEEAIEIGERILRQFQWEAQINKNRG